MFIAFSSSDDLFLRPFMHYKGVGGYPTLNENCFPASATGIYHASYPFLIPLPELYIYD